MPRTTPSSGQIYGASLEHWTAARGAEPILFKGETTSVHVEQAVPPSKHTNITYWISLMILSFCYYSLSIKIYNMIPC